MSEPLNLDAIEPWLAVCGGCDAGIGMCTHPAGDYRPVMAQLVAEVRRLRAAVDEAEERAWHRGFDQAWAAALGYDLTLTRMKEVSDG